jgi:cell division protein FtsZ
MCDNDSVPCIKVLGVGSAGGNVINRLYEMGVENAELIAIDLYKQHLDVIRADKKVLMKRPPVHGLICSGFHPWLGEQAASLSIETIEGLFQGSNLVLIIVGMGGNTGTGAAPIIARAAREQGAIVICIATLPFRVERMRSKGAKDFIDRIKKEVDTLVLLDDNRLLDHFPDLPLEQCFSAMDRIIAGTVKGIIEPLKNKSLVIADLEKIKDLMAGAGTADLLFGE